MTEWKNFKTNFEQTAKQNDDYYWFVSADDENDLT